MKMEEQIQTVQNIPNEGKLLFPKVTICPILLSRYNLTEATTGSEQKASIPTPLSISSCRSFPNGCEI